MISPSVAKYFWDVNVETLDIKRHKRYIITRLLNYGTLADWRWLMHTYGKKHIAEILSHLQRSGIRQSARRLAELIFS